MIELEFFSRKANDELLIYQMIQFSPEDPWRLLLEGELLGSMEKSEGTWHQVSGTDFSPSFLRELAAFIDQQNFNHLPLALTSRWGNLIHKVIIKSDREYLVVCKADISFRSFEGIFSKFVSGLLKDEWSVTFQVFNHDFSDDFTVQAKPTVRQKNKTGWDQQLG
ncbi:hypothetical protein [Pedobacter sp. MR22-3]|uniref:hypothetical protein n=1 Tax=Pedobacter sp. MR22-3 TaxID=2994552 RepID=UPI00224656DB|nr:hypothetical protein [Pedobacter sp. MR22-3]MCX2586294.1 hypothetical protein [Pedobacter sp. MR22-3]